MKTIILIMLFFPSLVLSQVTLTNSNNPEAGNTQWVVDCDTNGVVQGNAGANQTWSFTSLIRQDSSMFNWVSAGTTPYAGQFSSSTIASTNDNTSYNYFTPSSGNLTTNGTANPISVIPYTNVELYLQYPFTFNSSFNDNFSATYIMSGMQTFRTGTINVTGDAWGTINLPFGSFTNALRVKYVVSTKDSQNVGAPIVTITNVTSYVWFVPGKKFPVFEIVYSEQLFNGTSFGKIKGVNYCANNTTIGIQQISNAVPQKFMLEQNYPNPFNPSTKIKFDITESGFTNLAIFDLTGRKVEQLFAEELKAGVYEISWNASAYTSGTYFYKLTSGDFTQTRKMVLVK